MAANRPNPVPEHPPEFPQLCRFLAERSPQPMVAVEGVTHIVRYANPAFHKLLGKEDQHLLGRPFCEAVPEGMANGCVPLLDRVLATGTPEMLAEQEHGLHTVKSESEERARGELPSHWSYLVWAIVGPVEVGARADPKPVGVMIQVTDATETAAFRKGAAAINEALLLSGVRQHELMDEAEKHTAELRASAERFRFLAESMPQKIFTATPSGEIDYFNRQWIEFTGLTFEQIRDWGWTQFIHPDDLAENVRIWKHSLDTGQPFQFEHRFRRHDGVYRWHLSRAHCMLDTDGNSAMWIGSNTEIDDMKRTEEALRASEEQNRKLFQSVPAAVFSCDKDGVVQDYNRRAEEYWGRAPVRGDPAERYCGSFKLYLPNGTPLPHENSPMVEVLRDGIPRENVEVIIERPDRSRLPVLINFFPLTNPDGEITGAITCFSDITQLKRWEREREALLANEQASRMEAETANRSKDLFLATLSHEMRTPLNAIVGWMSILRADGCDEADLHEGLEVIDRNTRVQVQLIEDVLDVSRIVSGKLRLETKPCQLTEVVKAGLDVVRAAAEARDITLKAELDPAANGAVCDPMRIQQVVWNLLANAVKFTPRGGTVTIALSRERSEVKIRVTDTGQGMSAELLPFIFDRFRQADGSTRRKFGGLGLGLSIVRHLVELHGGTVEAHSPGEGRGSTFTVILPVRALHPAGHDGDEPTAGGAEDQSELIVPSGLPMVRLDGLRLLIVEDEADARRLLSKVLEQAGATVTAAGSAAEAMAALKKNGAKAPPHVLVSDIGMPEEDGLDLIRQVRKAGHTVRDLPAVALTAFVHKEDQRQALLAGFQVHVPKPVDPHDLTVVIASLAGRTG